MQPLMGSALMPSWLDTRGGGAKVKQPVRNARSLSSVATVVCAEVGAGRWVSGDILRQATPVQSARLIFTCHCVHLNYMYWRSMRAWPTIDTLPDCRAPTLATYCRLTGAAALERWLLIASIRVEDVDVCGCETISQEPQGNARYGKGWWAWGECACERDQPQRGKGKDEPRGDGGGDELSAQSWGTCD
eukprot:scaffold50341_cov25-Tisochrysis_lutea.AAC.1